MGSEFKIHWVWGKFLVCFLRSTEEETGQKSENQKNIFGHPSCYSCIHFPGEDLDALVSVSYDGELHMF